MSAKKYTLTLMPKRQISPFQSVRGIYFFVALSSFDLLTPLIQLENGDAF